MFWMIWLLVAAVAWMVKNLIRSRTGRAFQAVRDRDLAAEIIGVNLFKYKTLAFAISAALSSLAGALYAPLQGFVGTEDFSLAVSIEFIAIIILGGLSTIYGSIIGAVMITALPFFVEGLAERYGLPGVASKGGESGLVSIFSLNVIIYGLLIAAFLLFEPRGLAGVWTRVKAYFKAWPFSY